MPLSLPGMHSPPWLWFSVVETPRDGERQYAAALGSPQRVWEQLFALALRSGYGENTQVHGVGDGAPWIAQQIEAAFPGSASAGPLSSIGPPA